ncbi:MAG TPA: L,D-transpeptidase family protein [Solirubrobacteraceae bacterium]|jgi:lipoprotein-anchoring transpeptidase ErfK/SrfK
MTLATKGAHGRPPFMLSGERLVVSGVVKPFVVGQKVVVRFTRDGRRVATNTVAVLPGSDGTGRFRLGYASRKAGLIAVSATHTSSPQMSSFTASAAGVRFLDADLSAGARGPAVRLLQSKLRALHFVVPSSGVFDEGTEQAVIAYRKLTGLARVPSTDSRVFRLLREGAGRFPVRYPRDGRHVEADLARQVLAEIEPGDRVYRIYTISSGKPSTPTVLGRFRVYLKTPGVNSEGMVDSNYFIRGYAIHGYPEVPTYAASHGCLRVPIPDAPAIYAWVQVGTPVDVYY